jgi:cell division protein FtsX
MARTVDKFSLCWVGLVNLTQLLSNVEKQDENNISASAKTQDNNQQRIKIKTLEVRNISNFKISDRLK